MQKELMLNIMTEISDFISTVGFPVLISLLMIYQQEKMRESYVDIVNSLKELISDNTKSINLLISRAKENDAKMLEVMQGGIDENKQETSATVPSNQQGK